MCLGGGGVLLCGGRARFAFVKLQVSAELERRWAAGDQSQTDLEALLDEEAAPDAEDCTA